MLAQTLRAHFVPAALALLATLLTLGGASGCMGKMWDPNQDPGVGGEDGGLPPVPTPEPPPPTPAVYKRGSLPPLYELTPRAEYGRMAHVGVAMTDADFQSLQTTTSASTKIDEIAAQLSAERGEPVTLIKRLEDRQRADLIPFRGNPSDVKLVNLNNTSKAYLPLGGDVMTPGNEVAVVAAGNNPSLTTRVRVGIRPLKLAVHPAGLVFVCNQYSNYISIIDPRTDQLLTVAAQPVEVKTEYYCSDLVFVAENPNAPDIDEQFLLVANRWRNSVLKYRITLVRDPLSDRPVSIQQELVKEIGGVTANPWRITLSEQQNVAFVTSNKGGEVARIDIGRGEVLSRRFLQAPTADVVNIADQLYIPTTMPDRGLLARDEPQQPTQVQAAPLFLKGADGKDHLVHPGALFDGTKAYNFEDLRNGLFQVDFSLNSSNSVYYTDDISPEPNFVGQQKILAGAQPQAVVRNRAGTRIFVAMSGSELVQELRVNSGVRPFSVTAQQGAVFRTRERPFGLVLDEAANRLYVASWGGEVLEVFDLTSRQKLAEVDLGYAQPRYPATNIERGEFFYYNADWSNNGRKSCASCHFDELDVDGVGFSNGATTPTAFHQVKPNHNLMTTDSYFWNGSFSDGNYTSVAFAAQTRPNCELILFGMIEGPGSNPANRVGNPNNRVTNGNDAACRPVVQQAGQLPVNFAQIQQVIAAQKQVGRQVIQNETGFELEQVSRFMDFYSVSELRLPPNPLKWLAQWNELGGGDSAKLAKGEQLFTQAGCDNCHDPGNSRAPFTDGLDHGPGADWNQRFVNTYQNDQRLIDILGTFPQRFLDGITGSTADEGVNVHLDPLDYFIPFCFDVTSCLAFEDPLAVVGNKAEETRRLDLLLRINLDDPDREFIPGNLRGQPRINTASLRGVWTQPNLMHHGHVRHIDEAIVGPGHAALGEGELGYAISNSGKVDVHGATAAMSPADVEALVLYVQSIE